MATKRKFQEVKGGFPKKWDGVKGVLGRALEKNDVLEGYYKGYDNITSGGRTFRSYRIQPDGASENPSDWIGVAGGVLANTIERVPEGTFVRITYIGILPTESGEAKNFKLEVEEGSTVSAQGGGEHKVPDGA